MLQDLFGGTAVKTKPTAPSTKPKGGLNGLFFGGSNTPVKPDPVAASSTRPVVNKPTTHKFPESLGGGEFNLPANKLVTSTRSQDALGPTRKDAERDHIIPVSLGGTSSKENLQYLNDNKGIISKILGREPNKEERQSGKVAFEWRTIEDYKSGKISLAEARGKILQKQREIKGLDPKQGVAPYILPSLKEALPVKPLVDTAKGVGSKLKSLFADSADNLDTGIDPALRERLIKRGETEKLKQLEQEQLNKFGLQDYRPIDKEKENFDFSPKTKERQKQALEFGGAILQAPQRAITSVAGEAASGLVSLFKGKDTPFVYEPKTKFEKVLFGKEPIKGIFTRTEKAQEYVQTALEKAGVSPDAARGQALALAPLFMAGSIGLDLSPFGGGKNTANIIAKSKSADEIFNVIKPMFKDVPEGDLFVIAEDLVKVNHPQTVKENLLKNIAEVRKYQAAEVIGVKNEMKQLDQFDFPGQQQANYERFAEIVRDPKLLSPRAKEIIQSGDATQFKKLAENTKGFDPLREDIFGYSDKSDDEIFDMFRQRLIKENPNLLGKFEVSKNLDIPFESRNPNRILKSEKKPVTLANQKMNVSTLENIQSQQLPAIKQGVHDLSSKIQGKVVSKVPKLSNVSYSDSIIKPALRQEEARGAAVINDLNDTTHGSADKFTTPSNVLDKAEKFHDISGFKAQARDVYRNFKQVFGDKYPEIKKSLLDPFDGAKGKYVDFQKSLLDEMDKKIVKGLGIRKGSKESGAVMDYGEGLLKEGELLSAFGIEKGKKIKEAAQWFRERYDTLLDQVNEVRKEIYPHSPDKIIPKRKDYFRHFDELTTGLEALKNIFENPAGISPKLAGISPFTVPKSKWLSFAQRRLAKDSTRDAVGGFLNYVPSASYAINIDPFIGQFRKLGRELAEKTEDSKNINNFIEFLHDFSNDLSGKSNAADRFIQKVIPGGRKTFGVINWLNNRVKANSILGNLSSAVSQIFNVPQGIASAKQYSIPGATRTLAQIFQPNDAMRLSSFIKERYSSSLYNKFDTGILANTKKFAAWVVGALDEVGTKFIWNSHYEKALAEKITNPVKYADDVTRSLVAGRGIGEVPLIQKSKIFQFVAPFQLEVGNLWYVMGDMVKKKDFGALATLFVANYLMNRVAEEVRGSDVTFDPINALIQGFQNQAKDEGVLGKTTKVLGRLGGEILSNIPLGQTISGLYPESGKNIPGVGKMTRKELFGSGDPTRVGSGLLTTQGISDPLFKLIPGFGGGQLKKTYQGTKALIEGEQESKAGKILFEVSASLQNIIRAPAFGPYSTTEGQEYSDAQDQIKSLEAAKARKTQKDKDRIRPIYDEAWRLQQEGKKEEATALWDQLSDEEKEVFKKLKDEAKRERENQNETKMLKIVKQLYDLRDKGREDEALKIWNELSEEEKKAFQRVKKTIGY